VAEVKYKEGRHVGLDFYDLLIEAIEMETPEMLASVAFWNPGDVSCHAVSDVK
jgi:hypothetical protein